jgi:hypothetical protein
MSTASANKEIKKYLNEIKLLLPIHNRDKKAFLSRFEIDILDFVDSEATYNYDEIVSRFGEPKEVVANYLMDSDGASVVNRIKRARLIKFYVPIALVAVLIIAAISVGGVIGYHAYEKELYFTAIPMNYSEGVLSVEQTGDELVAIFNGNEKSGYQYYGLPMIASSLIEQDGKTEHLAFISLETTRWDRDYAEPWSKSFTEKIVIPISNSTGYANIPISKVYYVTNEFFVKNYRDKSGAKDGIKPPSDAVLIWEG